MKGRYLIGLAFVAGMVGAQSDKIIDAARFVVFGKSGKPAVVMTTDQIGGGEFAVFDANGVEVFAVRNGDIIAPSLQKVQKPVVVTPANGALSPSGGGTKMETPAKSSGRGGDIAVQQPKLLGTKPVVRIEVLDFSAQALEQNRWDYSISVRITNTASYSMSAISVGIRGVSVEGSSGSQGFAIAAGASTLATFRLAALSRADLKVSDFVAYVRDVQSE